MLCEYGNVCIYSFRYSCVQCIRVVVLGIFRILHVAVFFLNDEKMSHVNFHFDWITFTRSAANSKYGVWKNPLNFAVEKPTCDFTIAIMKFSEFYSSLEKIPESFGYIGEKLKVPSIQMCR